jgi:glycerol transport system ATP-binding protein
MPLVFDNVSKIVTGELHIHPTDIQLAPESFNTLLGPTGAGKTTLLRLMAGLDRPSEGHISVHGRDITNLSVRRRSVAMVYQQFVNYPNFTIFENVASPLKVAGVERKKIERKVREVAEMLHIGNCLGRLPAELSGGQQQRAALARALVKDADLLLLDEPLVNLDYKLREELRLELRSLLTRRGAIVVYATADPQEALALGGTTLVVDKGRVLQQGSAAAVYHHPASVRAAQLLSDPPMNVVTGRLEGAAMQLGQHDPVARPGHLRALPNGPCLFGVRPNHVLTSRRAPSDIEIRTRVELAEISGSETSIHFEHGGSSWVSRQDGVCPVAVDEPIDVYIDPQRIFAFDSEGTLIAAPEHSSGGRSA